MLAAAALRDWSTNGSACKRIVQLDPRIADVTYPASGIFLETSLQQASYADRCGVGQRRPLWFAFQNRCNRVGDGLTGQRLSPGQHFVEHAAKRPDVRPLVERLPPRLLRAHVGRSTQDGPLAAGEGVG